MNLAMRLVCVHVCDAFLPPSLPPQVINGTDILEVLHDYPELAQFVHSLYYCRYDNFFRSLGENYHIL